MNDPLAERAVLAAIYQHGAEAYYDLCDLVNPSCFSIDTNQMLYECFQYIFQQNSDAKPDLPTLLAAIESLGYSNVLNTTSERTHIRAVLGFQVNIENGRKFAATLKKLQLRKQLLEITEKIGDDLRSAPNDLSFDKLMSLVETPIFDFSTELNLGAENEPSDIGDGVDDYVRYLEENPCESVGISTGYPCYDRAIGGGLLRKSVSLIGSRPKVGKSAWSANVGLHISRQFHIPVLYLDTEMDRTKQQNRLLANISGVSCDEVKTGQFSRDKKKSRAVHQAAELLKRLPFKHISVAGRQFEEIMAICRRWVMRSVGFDENGKTKDCLVIYDYLKLMTDSEMNKNMQEFQLLGFQMTHLVNFCIRYDLPCLAFIQLNRDGITKESSDVVSGSDRLAWLCSNLSIFKTKSAEDIGVEGPDCGNRKLITLFSRDAGEMEGDHINMQFDGEFSRITELGMRSSMKKNKKKTFEVSDDILS